MSCCVHNGRASSGVCNTCGRDLCNQCVNRYNPPTCPSCMKSWGKAIIKENSIKIILSVIFLIFGFTTGMQNEGIGRAIINGLVFACVPYGWSALNKITPNVFLVLPLIGWLFYFIFKLVLAGLVGVFVTPFEIVKMIRNLKLANSAKHISY